MSIHKDAKKRCIKLYPDNSIVVITIGDKGDGTDNIVREYKNAYIFTSYLITEIRGMGTEDKLATYATKTIVFTCIE